MSTHFFATAAKGFETLLADELRRLKATNVHPSVGGVFFDGQLETAYRACLWSRVASRILMPLATFSALTPEELYAGARGIDWSAHLGPDSTLAVDCTLFRSRLKHSHFAALKVKDAIVDQLREKYGTRPSVALERPDVRVNLHVHCNRAALSIDLSGDSLHRRGWRDETGPAPLKENLAAALLFFCDWPNKAAEGGMLVDPMCGSGTIPIEAALMAAGRAPGLTRDFFGFLGWKGHDAPLWERLRREALSIEIPKDIMIFAYDCDGTVLEAARRNAVRAGVASCIRFQQADIAELPKPEILGKNGVVLTNPPYGERLRQSGDLQPLYRQLGQQLRRCFGGWSAGILTESAQLAQSLELPLESTVALWNGPLACTLYRYRIPAPVEEHAAPSPMLANRLRKNLRHLRRWARREGTDAFRIYDADLPEYAAAIDLYGSCAHVQEYAPPATIDPARARLRLQEIVATLSEVLEIAPDAIFVKTRQRQKGANQYQKLADQRNFMAVREGDLNFWVNLADYLDTGLFLDHRPTRKRIRELLASGGEFLNLFGYTGSASVYAAAAGAATTTVDASRTYLDWARRNFELNGLDLSRHRFVQADCMAWLGGEGADRRFDLIFADPPTFSNSSSRDSDFDVQRDAVALLNAASRLLKPKGILIFSCNFRRFCFEPEKVAGFAAQDISAQTIPEDFARSPRIHRCWLLKRNG